MLRETDMRKVNIVAMATMALAIVTVVTDLVRVSTTVDGGKAPAVQIQTTVGPNAARSDPI